MIIFQKLYIECDEDYRFNTELQKIFGIGVNNKLYRKYGFQKQTKFGIVNLMPKMEYHIESYILKNKRVSFPLKQVIRDDIRKKIIKKIYEGSRHVAGLSVRGQRTHSNCQTNRKAHRKYINSLPETKKNILENKQKKKIDKHKKNLIKNEKKDNKKGKK